MKIKSPMSAMLLLYVISILNSNHISQKYDTVEYRKT